LKKRLLIALAICVLATVGAALLLRGADTEPRHEGRPLSAWVNDLRRGTNHEKARAAEVLRTIGAEAAPYLAGSLGKKPGLARRLRNAISPRLPPTIRKQARKLFNPTSEIMDKYAIAEALRVIGTNGHAAVPALGELLNDGNLLLSVTASRALAQMGPEAAGPLMEALDHPDFNIRAAACDGLGQLGPAGAPAAPRLARILRSEVGPITSSAALALSRIGKASVPVLVPLLQDTNWTVRRQAAYALAYAGPAAKSAQPALLEAARDPHPQVRATIIDALGRIDPFSKESLHAADTALDDPDSKTRGAALQALRYQTRFVRENSDRVMALLNDDSPTVRGYAALALSVAPSQAQTAIPRLEELALETNQVVQASAVDALRIIRQFQTD
jgi:HEAT repeat protein